MSLLIFLSNNDYQIMIIPPKSQLLFIFIRKRIVICVFLTLYEGGKLTIPFYVYFPLLVSNRPLPALL
jgi:hypothetical protein